MSYTLVNTTFQEEIYSMPPRPVVVLTKPWEKTTAAEKGLLEKIIGLAQLSLNQVRVLTIDKLDVLQWRDRPKKVIAFGLDTPGLLKNEILDVQGIKVIVTSDLASLEIADKETKQKLAGALGQIFD